MSIRRLKTLIAIAESGTFAEAAETVCVTHAAVSQQIKGLEAEFGVDLFDRSKRSPQLNSLGLALVPKAREVIRAYEALGPSLLGKNNKIQGELTIGAVPTTMVGLVPKAMQFLKSEYPDIHIRIVPDSSPNLTLQVGRGFLDAAIIGEPSNIQNQMLWRPFAEEPLIVLAPIETPENDPKELLENYPFIRFSRRAWAGVMIDEWLRENNINVKETMELEALDAISAMVFNNLGVSIIPQRCIPVHHPLPLKRVPIGPSAKPRILGIITRKDTPKFHLIDIFLSELIHLVEAAGEVKVHYQQ